MARMDTHRTSVALGGKTPTFLTLKKKGSMWANIAGYFNNINFIEGSCLEKVSLIIFKVASGKNNVALY